MSDLYVIGLYYLCGSMTKHGKAGRYNYDLFFEADQSVVDAYPGVFTWNPAHKVVMAGKTREMYIAECIADLGRMNAAMADTNMFQNLGVFRWFLYRETSVGVLLRGLWAHRNYLREWYGVWKARRKRFRNKETWSRLEAQVNEMVQKKNYFRLQPAILYLTHEDMKDSLGSQIESICVKYHGWSERFFDQTSKKVLTSP